MSGRYWVDFGKWVEPIRAVSTGSSMVVHVLVGNGEADYSKIVEVRDGSSDGLEIDNLENFDFLIGNSTSTPTGLTNFPSSPTTEEICDYLLSISLIPPQM